MGPSIEGLASRRIIFHVRGIFRAPHTPLPWGYKESFATACPTSFGWERHRGRADQPAQENEQGKSDLTHLLPGRDRALVNLDAQPVRLPAREKPAEPSHPGPTWRTGISH